jgi:hypothetical protein
VALWSVVTLAINESLSRRMDKGLAELGAIQPFRMGFFLNFSNSTIQDVNCTFQILEMFDSYRRKTFAFFNI